MEELEEITTGKTLEELQKELIRQHEKQGESLGGTICSEIIHQIEQKQTRKSPCSTTRSDLYLAGKGKQ